MLASCHSVSANPAQGKTAVKRNDDDDDKLLKKSIELSPTFYLRKWVGSRYAWVGSDRKK